MVALRSVPDAQRRAIGLIRVSDVGDRNEDDLMSPELQETAIRDHCARRGYRLLEPLIQGIDESGSDRRSRWWAKLDQVVAMVEAGDAEAIVVWRFSRTARQRLKWATAIDRVEVAGGLLESATEPLDTSTASGRLARGMLGEMAAYEAEVIGGTWREVHARRIARGLPGNGKPRFGYRVVDGRFEPDPDTGPILAALYRRYIAGESMHSLATWLNGNGIYTVAGYSAKGPGAWSQPSLRGMLDRGFGAGFITVSEARRPGAHEAVIDETTWAAYLAAREARRGRRRGERSPLLLSSLVWCHCGAKMGGNLNGGHRPMWRCLTQNEPGGIRHPGANVHMPPVDAAVWAWVEELATELDLSADATLAMEARRARRRHDAEALAREVIELDKAIGRLVADRAKLPGVAYEAGLAELMSQRDQVERRRAVAHAEGAAGDPAKIATELLAHRDDYGVEHLRGLIRRIVRRVEVYAAGTTPDRVEVVPSWTDI